MKYVLKSRKNQIGTTVTTIIRNRDIGTYTFKVTADVQLDSDVFNDLVVIHSWDNTPNPWHPMNEEYYGEYGVRLRKLLLPIITPVVKTIVASSDGRISDTILTRLKSTHTLLPSDDGILLEVLDHILGVNHENRWVTFTEDNMLHLNVRFEVTVVPSYSIQHLSHNDIYLAMLESNVEPVSPDNLSMVYITSPVEDNPDGKVRYDIVQRTLYGVLPPNFINSYL